MIAPAFSILRNAMGRTDRSSDTIDHGDHPLLVDVGDRDLRTLACELPRSGRTDAAGATKDENDLSRDVGAHARFLLDYAQDIGRRETHENSE
jgi:hypothetical protein